MNCNKLTALKCTQQHRGIISSSLNSFRCKPSALRCSAISPQNPQPFTHFKFVIDEINRIRLIIIIDFEPFQETLCFLFIERSGKL